MIISTDVAIIGAGPYGLSLAAHLNHAGIDYRIFGSPASFWKRCMPDGMVLKSEGFASSLWDPCGYFTLRRYCLDHRLPYQDSGLPIPLETFCDYASAFQRALVPDVDERQVELLATTNGMFVLRLEDGSRCVACRVVLATGIGHFPHIPEALSAIRGAQLLHSTQVKSLKPFAAKEVLVIGGGASGIELAGLLSAEGARVTAAVRSDRIAFCGPPQRRTVWERLKAPESGLGTGWRSLACVEAPLLFHVLPQALRHLIVSKHLGPAPGWTSREAVEENVRVVTGVTVAGSGFEQDQPFVDFRTTQGGQTRLIADHVIAATGFAPDMRRLPFVSAEVSRRVLLEAATPVLTRHFETTLPGLFVIGALAANSFGPLLRFIYGAGYAAGQLTAHLGRRANATPSQAHQDAEAVIHTAA